jgi:hypothetical protein
MVVFSAGKGSGLGPIPHFHATHHTSTPIIVGGSTIYGGIFRQPPNLTIARISAKYPAIFNNMRQNFSYNHVLKGESMGFYPGTAN